MLPTLMIVSCASVALFGEAPGLSAAIENPAELGDVRFGDDLERALTASKESGKPVLLLFQEIPGCATCKGFGDGPLSHPLLVEAIETEFMPVVVHNNRGGRDAETLKRFCEPAWNNPVVRFLDARGEDLLPRVDGVWSSAVIAERMIAALRAAKRDVPAWLELAAIEAADVPAERAVFSMPCYWSGQARLGALDGVLSVAPGFVGGAEVTEVVFRPRRLAYSDLVRAADEASCAASVFTRGAEQAEVARHIVGGRARALEGQVRPAPAGEHLYHLQHTSLRWLPLTEAQATRANADIALSCDPSRWFSPRQKTLARRIDDVLRVKPDALAGLVRPHETFELNRYASALGERLSTELCPIRR